MQPLRAIIEAFRREVTAALNAPGLTAAGGVTDWKAERVTLSLDVILDEEGKVLARPVSPGTEAPCGHRLTIEFRLGSSASGSGVANAADAGSACSVAAQAPRVTAESNMEQAYEDLSDLLGAPGFDSSARAAVLCDALQTLTLPQAFALCSALTSPAGEVDDERLRRARHQILGIVRSGTLKSPERAAEILTRVFEQWPLPSLVRFVSDRWKITDNWAE